MGEINELPYELIFNILSKLPIKSVFQCRCVCKSWLNIFSNTHFANGQFASSQSTPISPSILLWSRSPTPNKMYFFDRETSKIFIQKTWDPNFFVNIHYAGFEFIDSCNGLISLSVRDCSDHVYICNPFTRQYIELPLILESYTHSVGMSLLGFGFATETKEYKVVKMRHRVEDYVAKVNRLQVEVYTLGTTYWRSKGTIPYMLVHRTQCNTFLNGALHWISADRGSVVVSFNLEDEEFRIIPLPELELSTYDTSRHVGVTWGCLSMHTFCNQGCTDIWLMREYGVKESWSKYFVFSEDRRFFYPLDIRKNGEHLLGYCEECMPGHLRRKLVTYDVGSGRFTDLQLEGVGEFDLVYPFEASLITLEFDCGGEKAKIKDKWRIQKRRRYQRSIH